MIWYSHFDGFVPVYYVARKGEQLHVDEMHVAPFRSYVQPLATERKVYDCNSVYIYIEIKKNTQISKSLHIFKLHNYVNKKALIYIYMTALYFKLSFLCRK